MDFYTKLVFALVFFLWIFSFTEANAERSDVGISAELIHNDSIYSPHRVHSPTDFQRVKNVVDHSVARHLDSTPSFNGSVIMANPSMQNYLMKIYLGTPLTPIWLVMDTTHDLLSLSCYLGCSAIPFASTFLCSDPVCMTFINSRCLSTPPLCTIGDGSFNFIVRDYISFSSSPMFPKYSINYEHIFNIFMDIPTDRVSLGNHSNSFINQLHVTTFAYCLPPLNSNNNGSINFGFDGKDIIGAGVQIVSTPLTTQVPPGQNNHLYFMTLLGINIDLGYTKINFPHETPNNDGNIVIDPSTFKTSLPPEMVDKIVIGLQKHIPCPRVPDVETANHLRLCYNASSCSFVPPIVGASFVGGNLCLPWNNIFTEIQKGIQCLNIVNTTTYATWGSAFQVGFTIEYNLAHKYIKFKPGGCS